MPRADASAGARAGPAGTSPGGVTIVARGATARRTRRMPIGRSGSSSSAPAGAAGGAGGSGWMRRSRGCRRRGRPRAAAHRPSAGAAAPSGARRRRPVRSPPGAARRDCRVPGRRSRGAAAGSGRCIGGRAVERDVSRAAEPPTAGALAGAARLALEASALALLGGAALAASALESSRRDLLMQPSDSP